MANNKNVGIVIGVSVLLLGVTAFFIYRGIKSSKDAMNKLNAQGGGVPTTTPTSDVTTPTTTTTTTTTTPTTTTTQTTPTTLVVQPKSASILREKPNTLSKRLVTFGSGQQIQVSGVIFVGGYNWYKLTEPNSNQSGFIRADQVSVLG